MPPSIAFITGASSGIGAGLARRLAADGYHVALAARRRAELEAVATDISAAGGHALVVPCDVSDRGQLHEAVERCRREWGEIDLLVCSAGISIMTRADAFRAHDIARVLEVNVLGSVYAIEAVLPAMLARRRGHLVGIGSLAGYGGLGGAAAYSASKAAQHNLFESLRVDLRGSGVAVTVVTPGFVRTPLTDGNLHPMPFLLDLDDAVDRMARAIHRRRRLHAFPFPLSTVVRLGQILPRALYDRLVSLHRRDKGARSDLAPEDGGAFHPGSGDPSSPVLEPTPESPPLRHRRAMTDRSATLIQGRRERLARSLGRPLARPHSDDSPLTDEARKHLLEEAEDLYWNELEWEHLTEEEATDGPPLTELTFPGLLAFVRGLLLTEANPDALAPAEPRPQVVEDLLTFLARRVLDLEEKLARPPVDEAERLRGELVMTDRLLDLVLYRFHGLGADEVEKVEAVRAH